MRKNVKEFEKRVEEIDDDNNLNDYTTQHVLCRQQDEQQI